MSKYTRSSIWKRTLAEQGKKDEFKKERDLLRTSFEDLRSKAEMLGKEISRDTPEYTLHDITHLDELWDTASLIAGDDFDINPLEAYVLGAAFMIHDLGMGLAAYPNGKADLAKEIIWKDAVTKYYKDKHGKLPSEAELLSPESDSLIIILPEVLRALHGKHANKLVVAKWQFKGTEYQLIDNTNLRENFGEIIGKIAHSHAQGVEDLDNNLGTETINAPSIAGYNFPREWTVDPIKIACVLRTADAAQISANRAPSFLRAIRKPSEYSDLHWNFQNKLGLPNKKGDKIKYTSTSSFNQEEAESWWLCYDTLKMIDHELHESNLLLSDLGKNELELNGVLGIEFPARLKSYIKVNGWEPVDTQIKVTDVATLVAKLGGEQLYGEDGDFLDIPLRELVQNSVDAIQSRRILENRGNIWGDVTITVGSDGKGNFIEIDDNGIGMSKNVLTGPFLDFGTSFWGSKLMHEELPGLETSQFISTGKFGIGFYSSFMWGKQIKITTRKYNLGINDTIVLEFKDGLKTRPLLRKATDTEVRLDGGTSVKIWIDEDWEEIQNRVIDLYEISSNFLTLEANLYYKDHDQGKVKVVTAGEWLTMSKKDFTKNLFFYDREDYGRIDELLEDNDYSLIYDREKPIGRLMLVSEEFYADSYSSYATIGGYTTEFQSKKFIGLIKGVPLSASRYSALIKHDTSAWKSWVTEQFTFSKPHILPDHEQIEYSCLSLFLCGDSFGLKIAFYNGKWITEQEFLQILDSNDSEYYTISDIDVRLSSRNRGYGASKEIHEVWKYIKDSSEVDFTKIFFTSDKIVSLRALERDYDKSVRRFYSCHDFIAKQIKTLFKINDLLDYRTIISDKILGQYKKDNVRLGPGVTFSKTS